MDRIKRANRRSVMICIAAALLAILLVVSIGVDLYNEGHMGDTVIDFSKHRSGFKTVAKFALDYYEKADKTDGDLKHIALVYDFLDNGEMTLYASCHYEGDEDLNPFLYPDEKVYLQTNEKLKEAFSHVDKAFYDHDMIGSQEGDDDCIVYVTSDQVRFGRGDYSVVYRVDRTRPDSEFHYVSRLSGLEWYEIYCKRN